MTHTKAHQRNKRWIDHSDIDKSSIFFGKHECEPHGLVAARVTKVNRSVNAFDLGPE